MLTVCLQNQSYSSNHFSIVLTCSRGMKTTAEVELGFLFCHKCGKSTDLRGFPSASLFLQLLSIYPTYLPVHPSICLLFFSTNIGDKEENTQRTYLPILWAVFLIKNNSLFGLKKNKKEKKIKILQLNMFFLPISGRSRINLDVILYINTSPKPKFYCLTSRPTSDFLFIVLLFEFLF